MPEGYSYFNERAGMTDRLRYIEAIEEAVQLLLPDRDGLPDYFVLFVRKRGKPFCRSSIPARNAEDFCKRVEGLAATMGEMIDSLERAIDIQGPEGKS